MSSSVIAETPSVEQLEALTDASPSILEQHLDEILEAVRRACSAVAFDWYYIVDPEDLVSDVLERLSKLNKNGRWERDLYVYGWPKEGPPRSIEAVIYKAAKSWAGGICSEERSISELGLTTAEVLGAVIDYDLVSDAPEWDSMPRWVAELAEEMPKLSNGDLGCLERWSSGDKRKKSNINRAAKNLARLVARTEAVGKTDHTGPGSRKSRDRGSAIRATRNEVEGFD